MEHDIRVMTESLSSLLSDIFYVGGVICVGIMSFWLLTTVAKALLELRNEKLKFKNRRKD
jgi:hypothetical protein